MNTSLYQVNATYHSRNGQNEHSYLVGVYNDLEKAKGLADEEYDLRGGRYSVCVRPLEINTRAYVTKRQKPIYEHEAIGLGKW